MAADYISVILNDSQGIPLLHHKGRGTTTLPTGKVDEGETPYDTCIREMREELGVEVTQITLAYTSSHTSPKGNPYRGWHFICDFKGEIVNNEPEKHSLIIESNTDWCAHWDVLSQREPA